jgi:hypothetical protein
MASGIKPSLVENNHETAKSNKRTKQSAFGIPSQSKMLLSSNASCSVLAIHPFSDKLNI